MLLPVILSWPEVEVPGVSLFKSSHRLNLREVEGGSRDGSRVIAVSVRLQVYRYLEIR